MAGEKGTAPLAGVCALGALGCVLIYWKKRRRELKSLFLLAAAVGFCLGCAGALVLQGFQQEYATRDGEAARGTIVLTSDSSASSYSSYASGYLIQDGAFPVRVRVYIEGDDPYYFGQTVEGVFTLKRVSDSGKETFWQKGLVGSVVVVHQNLLGWALPFARERAAFVGGLEERFSVEDESLGLVQALGSGYRGNLLDSSLYADFQVAGLAHMVAISGAHLSLVSVAFGSLLLLVRVKKTRRNRSQALFLLCFLLASAMPISGIRAAFMATLAIAAFSAKRRSDAQRALSICVCVVLALDPAAAVSTSFALSALSTYGILLYSSAFCAWFEWLAHGKGRAVLQVLAATVSANIATLPLSAAVFSQLSLIAPLSNVLASFLFAPATIFSVVSAAWSFLGLPGLWFVEDVALVLCEMLKQLVEFLAGIPFAAVPCNVSVPVALGATLLICVALYRFDLCKITARRAFALAGGAAAALLVAFIVFLRAPVQLALLDVGQGDAILLRDGARSFLVDTGNKPLLLKAELAEQGIAHLDALFITHADDDHCGAVRELAAVVQIDRIVVPAAMLESDNASCVALIDLAQSCGCEVRGIAVGDAVQTSRLKLSVLWPVGYTDDGGNADSLCLLASVDENADGASDYSCLLTGDLEAETVENLARQCDGAIDILKVGHHGSASSCSESMLAALSPRIALISVGRFNVYGHPTEAALGALGQAGCAIYRTDDGGTIVCSFESDGIHVRTLG